MQAGAGRAAECDRGVGGLVEQLEHARRDDMNAVLLVVLQAANVGGGERLVDDLLALGERIARERDGVGVRIDSRQDQGFRVATVGEGVGPGCAVLRERDDLVVLQQFKIIAVDDLHLIGRAVGQVGNWRAAADDVIGERIAAAEAILLQENCIVADPADIELHAGRSG